MVHSCGARIPAHLSPGQRSICASSRLPKPYRNTCCT